MQQQVSPVTMTILGAGLTLGGLWFLLAGFHVLPIPVHGADPNDEPWAPILIGFIVFLAGASLILQVLGHADANGEVAADAPTWMRAGQYLLGAALFAGFAALASFVALFGHAQNFSGGLPLLGGHNVSLARIAFGLGALMCWLGALAYSVQFARKLRPAGNK
jgi:hypothetical protein